MADKLFLKIPDEDGSSLYIPIADISDVRISDDEVLIQMKEASPINLDGEMVDKFRRWIEALSARPLDPPMDLPQVRTL